MKIQHNTAAMNTYRNYAINSKKLDQNMERLSSGFSINRAGDDAAGLAISERMRAQISGLDMAAKNAKDGISVVQTAEGALTEVHAMLNRMYTLAEQSANGTYSSMDRQKLQDEVDQLSGEIDRIADTTNFNGIKLLDGSLKTVENVNVSVEDVENNLNATLSADFPKSMFTAAATAKATLKVERNEAVEAKQAELQVVGSAVTGSYQDVEIAGRTLTYISTAADSAGELTEVKNALVNGTNAKIVSKVFQYVAELKNSITSVDFGSNVKVTNVDFTDVTNAAGAAAQIKEALQNGTNAILQVTADTSQLNSSATSVQIGDKTFSIDGNAYSSAGTTAQKEAILTSAISAGHQSRVYPISNNWDVHVKLNDDGNRATVTLTAKTAGSINGMIRDDAFGSVDTPSLGITATVGTAAIDIDNSLWGLDVTADNNNNITVTLTAVNAGQVSRDVFTSGIGYALANNSSFTLGSDKFTVPEGFDLSVTQNADNMVTATLTQRAAADYDADDIPQELTDAGFSLKQAGVTEKPAGLTYTVKIGDTEFSTASNLQSYSGEITLYKDPKDTGSDSIKIKIGETINDNTRLEDENGNAIEFDLGTVVAEKEVVSTGMPLQIGTTSSSYDRLVVDIEDMHISSLFEGKLTDGKLKLVGDTDEEAQNNSAKVLDSIKNAIDRVSETRGSLGAYQNRLGHTINNLNIIRENLQDAESTIRDTDVAEEAMKYTKNSILVQSAQAMLAQANQQPQSVTQLLG